MAARAEGFTMLCIMITPSLVGAGCTNATSMVIGLLVSSVEIG